MIPGIRPTVDYAFKKVFGSESEVRLLLSLLEAVLRPPPGRRIVGLDIRNPFNSKDSVDDKLSILDIKARDEEGRQYNVEMQMIGSGIYPQRVLYYWAGVHSRQLHAGDSYEQLRPTISISFVNSVLFPDVRDYHLNFQLRSLGHPKLVFSEHQSIHVIELPKFRRNAEELVDPLDMWCYFLKHGGELDTENLPRALDTPAVRRAMEVLTMMTQNEVDQQKYLDRLRAERDQLSLLREREETLKLKQEVQQIQRQIEQAKQQIQQEQQQIQQERQEGRQEGRVVARIQFLQELLKVPLTSEEELFEQPLAELQAREAALAHQLGGGR